MHRYILIDSCFGIGVWVTIGIDVSKNIDFTKK